MVKCARLYLAELGLGMLYFVLLNCNHFMLKEIKENNGRISDFKT